MAKNWTVAEAVAVIREGKNKEDISDIAKRFPLFAVNAAANVEGLVNLLSAMPEYLTARKIETVLKDGVQPASAEDTDEDTEEEEVVEEKPAKAAKKEKAKKEKPAKEEKPAKGKAKKAKPEPQPEPEDEDWDDEEDEEETGDGLDEMSIAELKKEAKKRKINIKGLKDKGAIIAALRGEDADEEDEEDEDDDWDLD